MSKQTSPTHKPIILFDTTLRDGEQAPGFSMFEWEKLDIAMAIAKASMYNTDPDNPPKSDLVLEAGFPSASEGEKAGVKSISSAFVDKYQNCSPVVAGLAMAREDHVQDVIEAVEPSTNVGKGRVHIFIASSQIHADRKLRKTQQEITDMALQAISYAKDATSGKIDIEFSPEDASRTGWDFLVEICKAAAKAGASTINVPDTVGYAVPEEFGSMVKAVADAVRPYNTIISVHCHNDLGNATANTFAGLMNGATQVEGTFNGIGERSGNASIEQILMNLQVRPDFYGRYGLATSFDTTQIGLISRMVSMATGQWPSANTPIVGTNAFSHESGIHQDGVGKDKSTYEIMTPDSVGWVGEKYISGKHSGKTGMSKVAEALGYLITDPSTIDKIRDECKQLADKQKYVFDHQVRALIESKGFQPKDPIIQFDPDEIVYTRVVSPVARIENMTWGDIRTTAKGQGNGPVDAAFQAIDEFTNNGTSLIEFRISALGQGTDSLGLARVVIERGDKLYVGRSGHTDIVAAAASAYVNAINRAIVDR